MADENAAIPDSVAQANPKSGPVEAPPTVDPSHNKTNNGGSNAPAWLMLLVYGGAAAVYAAWTLPATRQIVDQYWQYGVIVLVVVIAAVLILKPAMSTGQKRRTLVAFIVVP